MKTALLGAFIATLALVEVWANLNPIRIRLGLPQVVSAAVHGEPSRATQRQEAAQHQGNTEIGLLAAPADPSASPVSGDSGSGKSFDLPAWVQAISAIVGTGTAIFLARVTNKQARFSEMQVQVGHLQATLMDGQLKATETAANAAIAANNFSLSVFKATQRPWISIASEEIAVPLSFGDLRSDLTLKFTLQNTGTLPAVRVSVWPVIYLIGYGGSHPDNARQEWLRHLRAIPRSAFALGQVIFPGEKREMDSLFSFDPEQVERLMSGQESAPVIAIAVVHYQSSVDETRHFTATIFLVEKCIESRWASEFMPQRGIIDNTRLRLSRHPMGTTAD